MKLLFAVASVVTASVDLEQSSLLQSNVKKDSKDRVDILPVLERAAVELSTFDADVSEEEVGMKMTQLFQKVQQTSVSVLQLPETEQIALFRRASQGQELKTFSDSFANLSPDVKRKVIKAVLSSEEMIDTYDALPEQDQQAVLMQLGQNPFDSTTQPKDRPKTRSFKTMEDGVSTKVTETKNGDYLHRTSHNKFGTDSTTEGKNGYKHSHSYKHNGYGGDAKTQTASSKGSWVHEHGHSHEFDAATGTTKTSTKTVSKGKGILDLTHEHDHMHQNIAGKGTQSSTRTRTASSAGVHTHGHDHYHNDQTGRFDSDANSGTEGPKWGEIFGGDDSD